MTCAAYRHLDQETRDRICTVALQNDFLLSTTTLAERFSVTRENVLDALRLGGLLERHKAEQEEWRRFRDLVDLKYGQFFTRRGRIPPRVSQTQLYPL